MVRDEAAVAALAVPDMDKLRYVFDAVTSIRRALDGRVPLIGFSGSPWTLACYMVEGKGSDDYRLVKTLMYSRPDLMHRILAINADAVAAYLNAQIDAGAQAVMVFDSWGGVLADGAFQAFSLAYTKRVLAQLQRTGVEGTEVPRIVFTKGGALWLDAMKDLDCEVLGLDWTANLARARALVGGAVGGPGKALQGNIDPNVLFAPPEQIALHARAVLDSFGPPHRPDHHRPHAHLQPGPRHQPVHAPGACGGAGRNSAPPFPRVAPGLTGLDSRECRRASYAHCAHHVGARPAFPGIFSMGVKIIGQRL